MLPPVRVPHLKWLHIYVIEQQQAICAVIADNRKPWCKMPSEYDMAKVLEPLSYFIDDSDSGALESTMSLHLQFVHS